MLSPTSCASLWIMGMTALTVRTQTVNKTDHHDLLTSLFRNYSRDIRPARQLTAVTHVYIAVQLLSILEMNEQDQTLKTNILLHILWVDEHLTWDQENHGNISYIQMRQKKMWLPDIVVDNTVVPETELGYDNLKLRVIYNGLVWWSPSAIIETACDIDITYYPFDTQVCELIFKTSISVDEEIFLLINETTPVDLSRYSSNGLWTLLNISAENGNKDEYYKAYVKFKLKLQRRRSFYILNIVFPVCLLSLTAALVFALPSRSEEKMGLSVTILLAYSVYLTIVTDSMPKTSVQVSVLTLYLILLLAVTATSVILSVFMLRLHHRPSPLTGCLATVTMILRTLLCMSKPSQPQEKNRSEENPAGNGEEIPGDSGSRTTSAEDLTPYSKRLALSGRLVAETWDKFFFFLFSFITTGSTITCLIILLVGAKTQEVQTSLA